MSIETIDIKQKHRKKNHIPHAKSKVHYDLVIRVTSRPMIDRRRFVIKPVTVMSIETIDIKQKHRKKITFHMRNRKSIMIIRGV